MDESNRSNQRRNALQISNDPRTNETNQVTNEPQNDERLPLSLSLGPTSYSTQISPATSSLRQVPPPPFNQPMTTWPSPELMARIASSQPPLIMNSYYQSGSNLFPPAAFAPISNQTQAIPVRPMRPMTNAVVPRRFRSLQSSESRKDDTIPPPFPWATNKRGRIHSLEYLVSNQITTITGDVQCRYCERVYQVSYNLREKFAQVEQIFVLRKRAMRERAYVKWIYPEPVTCELCGREKAVKPVIAERKSRINWLFLLLGQTLGYCTLEQLKNFCKHSKSHRTGAKDRVLYLTYLGLCKMLEPNRDLFNRQTRR